MPNSSFICCPRLLACTGGSWFPSCSISTTEEADADMMNVEVTVPTTAPNQNLPFENVPNSWENVQTRYVRLIHRDFEKEPPT